MRDSDKVTLAAMRGLMRAADVADFLGVSPTGRGPALGCGWLPVARMMGRRRMWERTEIEAWADRDWWGSRPWREKPSSPQ